MLNFVISNILLGIGLAMDAFSISIATGLAEPEIKTSKTLTVSGTFGLFQFAMPMLGWICVHTMLEAFRSFEKFIPWIALILLLWIGGKMLIEGIKGGDEESSPVTDFKSLMVLGVATSIDALSVGFTIAEYNLLNAIIASVIIGVMTSLICYIGVIIGRKAGNKLMGKASILGGAILIAIGIEIFVKGIF